MSDEDARIRLPLGKRIASHHARPVSSFTYLGWLALTLALAAIVFRSFGLDGALIAACLTLSWALAASIYRRKRCVDLHQNGIELRHGGQHRWLLWNQLHEIYQTPLHDALSLRSRDRAPKKWMYRLVSRDGRSIRLHDLESLRELGTRIQEQFKRRHLPVALDAFRAGYNVRFGKHLSVSQEGIYFGSRLIAWEQIREITIDEAHEIQVLRVGDRNPKLRLSSSVVPNLLVLDGILRATQETSSSGEYDLDQPSFLNEDMGSTLLERDPSELLNQGYDWEEINQVRSGQLSIDELLTRGPGYRPRRPR